MYQLHVCLFYALEYLQFDTLHAHIYVDTIICYLLINVSEYPSIAISYPSTRYPSTDKLEYIDMLQKS